MTTALILDGQSLTLAQVIEVARQARPVAMLSDEVRARLDKNRAWIQAQVEADSKPMYGINTGFGSLVNKRVPQEQTCLLSHNLILTCMAGTGEAVPVEVVRAMMLIRANTLLGGLSGVTVEGLEPKD